MRRREMFLGLLIAIWTGGIAGPACNRSESATPDRNEPAKEAAAMPTSPAAAGQLGAEFSQIADTTLATILAAPEQLVGKEVRLTGRVAAMCHHKRDWFALVDGNDRGKFVRVLTTDKFEVPPDAIGKTVAAEGIVEMLEVDEETARHFNAMHEIGAEAITGPQRQVVIRATGARFD